MSLSHDRGHAGGRTGTVRGAWLFLEGYGVEWQGGARRASHRVAWTLEQAASAWARGWGRESRDEVAVRAPPKAWWPRLHSRKVGGGLRPCEQEIHFYCCDSRAKADEQRRQMQYPGLIIDIAVTMGGSLRKRKKE